MTPEQILQLAEKHTHKAADEDGLRYYSKGTVLAAIKEAVEIVKTARLEELKKENS